MLTARGFMANHRTAFFSFCLVIVLLVDLRLTADEPWIVHSSFEDFASGTLGDGGVNLYVAKSGRIEMINRLDFDNDGYLDVLVVNDHNSIEGADVLVYWGSKTGPTSLMPPLVEQLPRIKLLNEIERRKSSATRLPSVGGGRSILADLNGDGYEEIIFCNFKHNYTIYSEALIYWNSPQGYRADRRTELPTLLPGGVAAADFNRDGFVDLAFANRGNFEWLGSVKPYAHLESYIYWNGPSGFDVSRRTSIPSVTARDCVAGDMNQDGYADLLLVNNNRQEKSVYLYWGGSDGLSTDRRVSWKSADPIAATLADLDGDKTLDLVLLHKNDQLELFYGNGNGFEQEPRAVLPTVKAEQCAVADLDDNGTADLVLANQDTMSYVYWGDDMGYAVDRRMELPTLAPSDVELADFNNDGRLDIAFSNRTDGKSSDVNSYIYWNSRQGFDAADRCEVLGFSPDSVNAADLNHDGHQDLVLVSHISGGHSALDSFIYWGNARHRYSTSSMTIMPRLDAVGVADLNQDGYVDMVGGYEGQISWGGSEGFTDPESIVDSGKAMGVGVAIADLNRDGFLDLVMPRGHESFFNDGHGASDPPRGVVLWGSADGYQEDNKIELELSTLFSQSVNIADLNKDGFLDLLFPGLETGRTHIFWGAVDGSYNTDRQTILQAHNASTIEIADLDGDSWLDLIFGGGWDINNLGRPTKFGMIFWGGKNGFSRQRSLKLESFDSLESSVADLNKDGHLDIVFTNYHGYFTRRIPAFIYWGGPEGTFSESRRVALPAESSSAITIADFNQDEWLDLFICDHVIEGDHTVGSNIFWGGPDGYSKVRSQWLPTFGPHFSVGRDVGNIYDRRMEERYISRPLKCPDGKRPSRLSWQATTPHGTGVKFQIRSASSRDELEQATWNGLSGEGSYFDKNDVPLNVSSGHRWVQYLAVLTTPDGGSTPRLEEVTLRVH